MYMYMAHPHTCSITHWIIQPSLPWSCEPTINMFVRRLDELQFYAFACEIGSEGIPTGNELGWLKQLKPWWLIIYKLNRNQPSGSLDVQDARWTSQARAWQLQGPWRLRFLAGCLKNVRPQKSTIWWFDVSYMNVKKPIVTCHTWFFSFKVFPESVAGTARHVLQVRMSIQDT